MKSKWYKGLHGAVLAMLIPLTAGIAPAAVPLSVSLPVSAAAVTADNLTAVTVNGLTYTPNDAGGMTLIGITSRPAALTIPSTIDGKKVTEIGDKAFRYCTQLQSVTIPRGVTRIGERAFEGCLALKDITLPDTVTDVGIYAFASTGWFDSQPDGDVYIGKVYYRYKGIMPAQTTITVRSGTVSIADGAVLQANNLIGVVLPNSIKTIGSLAFRQCRNLTKVTLAKGLTAIGSEAFYYCTSLTGITLPDSVKVIGEKAFEHCWSLKRMTLPDSLTSISDWAFAYCKEMTSVSIPHGVTHIGLAAFTGCGLESVTVPDSVTTMAHSVFNGCASMTRAVLPDSVKELGTGIFSGCRSLKEVRLPKGMTAIPNETFMGCSGMTEMTIPNGITSIGQEAFGYCTGLTSLSFPNSVTTIGERAFGECTGLKTLRLPSSLQRIHTRAFEYCTGLHSITIPNGVLSVGLGTFEGCNHLTSVTLPSSVTRIGKWSFAYCTGLVSIIIPNSVTEIGENAFEQCEGLTVYGQQGSAAETYAAANGISFSTDKVPAANVSYLLSDTFVPGGSITVRGKVINDNRPYTYAVYYRKVGTTKWTTVQGYKTNSIVTITPKAAVDYEVRVAAKDAAGKIIRKDMTVVCDRPLVNTSTISADTITLGEKVKVRCFATGGKGDHWSAVYYKKASSDKWIMLRNYSTRNIVMVKPSAAVPYEVRVDIKDKGGNMASKTFTLTVNQQ